jgi:thiosulfate dehydrogenase [quinone] large subunit
MIDTNWTGEKAGTALTNFLHKAITLTEGTHPEVSSWYASFLREAVLNNASFFSHLVAWGEFLAGIALIVGCFTSIAAFSGIAMNMSYLLAGTSSINPQMLIGEILLLIGGWNSGKWGLDHWIIPYFKQVWCRLKRKNPS